MSRVYLTDETVKEMRRLARDQKLCRQFKTALERIYAVGYRQGAMSLEDNEKIETRDVPIPGVPGVE